MTQRLPQDIANKLGHFIAKITMFLLPKQATPAVDLPVDYLFRPWKTPLLPRSRRFMFVRNLRKSYFAALVCLLRASSPSLDRR
jgi:hypothetical protein